MENLCNQTLHASKDQIRLQLMSDQNMKCQLIIDTPGSKQMMLFFNSIDIEQTDACRYAFLEIDDGRSRDDPFIGGNFKLSRVMRK